MGGSGSTNRGGAQQAQIALIMMPVFFTAGVSPADVEATQKSWAQIVNEGNAPYISQKIDPNFSLSGKQWFAKVFFERLFDVHPLSRKVFTKAIQNGIHLERTIAIITTTLADDKSKRQIVDIATQHCERGIKVIEYGVFGETLLHSLKLTLGDLFTPEVQLSWMKVYSEIMRLIVPVVIDFEQRNPGKYAPDVNSGESQKI
jgi:hemoglobin-like flavoprotein